MNIIHYRDSINFTKQRKSTPKMGWLVWWGTRVLKLRTRKQIWHSEDRASWYILI